MDYAGYAYADSAFFVPTSTLESVIHPDLKNAEPWSSCNYRMFNSHPVTDGTTPLPTALPPRQCTPPDQYSSTCSSIRSPVGESDYGLDNSPSTPPDDMVMSPYPFDNNLWAAQAPFMPLTQFPGEFVKPGEVSIYPEHIHHTFLDEKNPEFPHRSVSMSTNTSAYDQGTTSQLDQRHATPSDYSPEIKDEIRIPDPEPVESYPPPPGSDEGEFVMEPSQADEKNDDSDYRPRGSRKPAGSSRNTKHGKRPSTSSPAQPPATKKTKLESVASTVAHRPNKASIQGTRGHFPCKECPDITFKDENGLQKHIKQQHTRPFLCVFNFAGCESTFASKNEWKRHVASQHLLLNYWLCQQDSCAKLWNGTNAPNKAGSTSRGRPSSGHPSSNLPNGAIFNRKDLYTQHLRRMHIPPAIKKQVKQKKTVPEWEDRIRAHQEEAHRLRCDLPDYMECPAQGCHFHFSGPNAWDERMEHVAKHLEQSAGGTEVPVVFGGPSDHTLMNWASRPDVAVVLSDGRGKWRLNNPLKPEKSGSHGGSLRSHSHTAVATASTYSEEDAPGEEIDE